MKNILFALLLVFSVGAVAAQTAKNESPAAEAKSVQSVEKINKEIDTAMEERDAAAMKIFLTDDFINISGTGKLFTRKQYLAEMKTFTIKTLKSTDAETRIFADTAIVNGTVVVLYQNSSGSDYFYTRVYVWNKDKWLLASAQYTEQNK